MHINRHIRAAEILQPARMIEMQVPDDDGLDVLDVVARLGDGGGQLVLGLVADAREEVVERGAPGGRVVLSGARLEEDEAFGRVRDQDGDHGQFAALVWRVGVAVGAGVAAAEQPAHVDFQVAKVEELVWGGLLVWVWR